MAQHQFPPMSSEAWTPAVGSEVQTFINRGTDNQIACVPNLTIGTAVEYSNEIIAELSRLQNLTQRLNGFLSVLENSVRDGYRYS